MIGIDPSTNLYKREINIQSHLHQTKSLPIYTIPSNTSLHHHKTNSLKGHNLKKKSYGVPNRAQATQIDVLPFFYTSVYKNKIDPLTLDDRNMNGYQILCALRRSTPAGNRRGCGLPLRSLLGDEAKRLQQE